MYRSSTGLVPVPPGPCSRLRLKELPVVGTLGVTIRPARWADGARCNT